MLRAVGKDEVRINAVKGRAILFFAIVMLGGLFTAAQASAIVGFQGFGMRQRGRGQMPSVDDQLKRMTKDLKLTDEQQTKVKPILEDQRQQMQQLRSDTSLSQDEKFSKMRELHEQASSQIKSLLNQDQQKKFEEHQQKRRERWQSRQGAKNDKE
jgi:Spy/CpxP family protein refolding chaperone